MQLNEQPQKPNQVIEPTATRQPAPSRLKYLNKAYKSTNSANQQPKKGSTKAEQEYDLDLFNRYQQSKVISEETGKILKSDLKLRNEIAERNARLVSFVVNRLFNKSPRHKDLREDLIQEGHLGLYKAIDGFKPELGFKFSTYAV
jgi:RNA polymerase nonessential primary-like sigma factor